MNHDSKDLNLKEQDGPIPLSVHDSQDSSKEDEEDDVEAFIKTVETMEEGIEPTPETTPRVSANEVVDQQRQEDSKEIAVGDDQEEVVVDTTLTAE